MTNQEPKWLGYLDNLSSPNKELANTLWNALKKHFPNIRIPQAGPLISENTGFQFAWDSNEHHLEIDILYDKLTDKYELDWFYRNRKTDTYNGSDCLLFVEDLNTYPELTLHIKKILK
jgi:hypothetical protein